ncbi:nuclear divisionprotein rft1, partial [Diplocarpon rosae]
MASLLNHEPSKDHNLKPYMGQYQPPYGPPQPQPPQPVYMDKMDSSPQTKFIYPPPAVSSPPAPLPHQSRLSPLASDPDRHQYPLSPGSTQTRPQALSASSRPSKHIKRRRAEPARASDPDFVNSGAHASLEHEGSQFSRRGSPLSESSSRHMSAQPTAPPAPPAMQVSGLLGDGKPRYAPQARAGQPPKPQTSSPGRHSSEPNYCLRMRQQPVAARACGFGERDRRVIDPPPILQMDVNSPSLSPATLAALIRSPFSVVHCTLWDPDTNTDATAMPGTSDKRQQRRLMGTLVASPFVGKDEHGVEGCFFTFPDLSVRTPGRYSLKFALVNLVPGRMGPGQSAPILHVIWSDEFQVFNAKDFGGMRASTELTKALRGQG